MAHFFDAGEGFAFDKPAGTACRFLDAGNHCSIHDRRAKEGMTGCITYDCKGAGQRLCEEVMPDVDWREGAAQTARVIAAFAALRQVHEGIEQLVLLARFPLTPAQEQARLALLADYHPTGGWSEESLRGFAGGDLPGRLTAFLRGLAPGLTRAGRAATDRP